VRIRSVCLSVCLSVTLKSITERRNGQTCSARCRGPNRHSWLVAVDQTDTLGSSLWSGHTSSARLLELEGYSRHVTEYRTDTARRYGLGRCTRLVLRTGQHAWLVPVDPREKMNKSTKLTRILLTFKAVPVWIFQRVTVGGAASWSYLLGCGSTMCL
jgi:hypothetical protein